MYTKLFHIVFSLIFLVLGTTFVFSQEIKSGDSIKLSPPEALKIKDSVVKDSAKNKKPFLDGIVNMKAKDYEKMDQKKKQLTLYNEASIKYTDFDIKAGKIVYDFEKKQVYAGRIKDSAGNYIQRPVFTQGTNVVEPDSIVYNNTSGKALIWNSRNQSR